MARFALIALSVAAFACARRRDDVTARRDPAPMVDSSTPEIGSADTGPDVTAAFPIGRDTAYDAIDRLSPAMKRLKAMKSVGGNIGGMYGDESTNCGPADSDCVWTMAVGVHRSDTFETWEWCSVHAFTGEVKCGEPPRIVGFAKAATLDAGGH